MDIIRVSLFINYLGAITQLVECHNGIVKASGSSPLSSITIILRKGVETVTLPITLPFW